VPYQYKREPLSDDEVNRLTNTFYAFGEKFVIWTLLATDLMVSSLGRLWQQLVILRNGLYGHTFNL
jgi:integrase/recombinase XerD